MPKLFNKLIVLLISLWWMVTCAQATSPSGIIITGQATAVYFDSGEGESVKVLSNQASVIAATVVAMTLEQYQAQSVAPGQPFYFIHRLTNKGNAPDRFQIELNQTEGLPIDNLNVYEYLGTLPAPGSDPITRTHRLQPGDSIELIIMGSAQTAMGTASVVLLSAISLLDGSTREENLDMLVVAEQAATLHKKVDKTEAFPGDLLEYTLELRNTGDQALPERQLTLDGKKARGILLEDELPVYTSLYSFIEPEVIPVQAKAVVRTLKGNRWISFDQWDKQEVVTRIGLFMPADHLATGQPAKITFRVIIERGTQANILIQNKAFLSEGRGRSIWLVSNNVTTKVLADTKPSVIPGVLRFVAPASTDKEPEFRGRFSRTGYFYLTSDQHSTRTDVFLEIEDGGFRRSNETVNSVDVLVQSGAGGKTTVKLIETGRNTGLFRSQFPLHLTKEDSSSSYCGAQHQKPDYGKQRSKCKLLSQTNDVLIASVRDPVVGETYQVRAGVSPQGRIFDTATVDLTPLANARVSFVDLSGNEAINFSGDLVDTQVTDKDGVFYYPKLGMGEYYIKVDPPDKYVFPSLVPKEILVPKRKVTDASYGKPEELSDGSDNEPEVSAPSRRTRSISSRSLSRRTIRSAFSGKGAFFVPEDGMIDAFDVPLDPVINESQFSLIKDVNQKTVITGELVGYELEVRNLSDRELYFLQIEDTLPFGFRYMKGSTRVNGKSVADPDGGPGQTITFKVQSNPAIAKKSDLKITYALQAGAGAIDGDGVNRAIATAKTFPDGKINKSNEATAQVNVLMDRVLSDKAALFGKVYVDSNGDGLQNSGEWPIGGVRLYMEDGTRVITDENGQYSLTGLNPGNHILRVDSATMPEGLTLKPLDNRNGADGNSRFVDLSRGDMHRADFAAFCPTVDYESIVAQIEVRNKNINGDWLLDDATQYQRSSSSEKADSSGDLSNGTVGRHSEKNSRTYQPAQQPLTNNPGEKENQKRVVKIPLAAEAIKTVTHQQALEGTWLWPPNQKADGRFMAVVRVGVMPTLYVNGVAVSSDRLGEQFINNREQAQLMVWYGVPLQEGENRVEIKTTDMFGNERVIAKGSFIQSGSARQIEIISLSDTLVADEGKSLLPIRLRMLDNHEQLASGVYFVTLESSAGTWHEPDIQDKEPGHQVRIDQGELTVHLRSGAAAGPVTLKVSTGDMKADAVITQVAAPRPMIAVGLLEVNAGHGSVSGSETSLDAIRQSSHIDQRAAIFAKGQIVKDTQLTLSYDSKKNDSTELFRDVNPDDYYPIIGDASEKGYEAQSRSKVYAKVENNRSVLMWGDYQTDSNGSEHDLARIQRNLTGANGIYDNGTTKAQGFVARPEDQHTTELIEPNGTAMNYRLKGAPVVRHSDVLVLETLDQQNGVVLKTRNLSRGIDYTLDQFNGYLKFTRPVNRRDETGDIQQIRASYDLEGKGEAYTVAGVRVAQKINEQLTAGVSYSHNGHTTEGNKLQGGWVEYKPTKNTTLAISVAHMNGKQNKNNTVPEYQGNAAKIMAKQKWSNQSDSELVWARAGEGFKNSGSGISEGREETRLHHKQPITHDTDVRVEAETSRSLGAMVNESRRLGVFADHKTSDGWKLIAGSRYISQRNEIDNERFITVQTGVEKPFRLLQKEASVKAEYEQALSHHRWRAGIESHWQIHDKADLYSRLEHDDNISTSSVGDSKNEFSFGLKSKWLPKTKTYSEYRMRGVTDGRNVEWVNGAEVGFEPVQGLSLSPNVEWINTLSGDDRNDGLSVSVGLQDKRHRDQRINGRIEYRKGKDKHFYGLDTAIARRLTLDWSTLLREEFRMEPSTRKQALTLGLAHRPRLNNVHHGLYLYQWKEERGENLKGHRRVHLMSTHQNRQINNDLLLSGRIGSKWIWTTLADYTCDSQVWVLDSRLIYDVNRRWGVDVRGGLQAVDGFDSVRWSAGFGLYYLVMENLRVGVYYNVAGFRDKDLDAERYNAEGIHLSLQFKFDESIFDWFKS